MPCGRDRTWQNDKFLTHDTSISRNQDQSPVGGDRLRVFEHHDVSAADANDGGVSEPALDAATAYVKK